MVDFSKAQASAFILAFSDFQFELRGVYPSKWNSDEVEYKTAREDFCARAEKLERGCLVHWLRSVKRITKNGHIIPLDKVTVFESLAHKLRTVPDWGEFEKTRAAILKLVPNTVHWLKWWDDPKMGRLIYSAMQVMPEELLRKLPTTSNPVESLHHSINVSCGSDHQIARGLSALLRYSQKLERQQEALECTSLIHNLTSRDTTGMSGR